MKSKLAIKILGIIEEELPFLNTIKALERIKSIESCPKDVREKCNEIEKYIRYERHRNIF